METPWGPVGTTNLPAVIVPEAPLNPCISDKKRVPSSAVALMLYQPEPEMKTVMPGTRAGLKAVLTITFGLPDVGCVND
jgi:hypothetical protein